MQNRLYARKLFSVLTIAASTLAAGILVTTGTSTASAQEPLRVRRNFMGMHNLKDGGPDILTGFHWTRNLTGDTGYVFDWVFDYSLTSNPHWVGEAIQLDLVPCVRVQECNGGCTPDPGYAGQVASLICDWKLANPQYADRLVYLQLWNEPGDPRDFVPMDVYADYLVAAHNAVHNAEAGAAQINPDIAGTLKTMTPGQNNPDSWEEGFSHNPAAAFAFDVWGTHPYPESYPPHYNMHEGHGFVTKHKMIDGYLRDLDKCAEYGRRGVKVMITETAYGDHLGISYEGYPKTTRQMAADYNVEAFGTWWYQWPEVVAVHPFILSNVSWNAFAWANGGSTDSNNDGIFEPTDPFPQYTDVRNWRINAVAQGQLAPARLSPYRGPVGKLQGSITRSDTGEPVKHANVFTDGYEFGGPSLFDGQYDVYDVPVGTYTLTVNKRGYLPAAQQITVTENQTTVTDFSLVHTGKVPRGFYFVDCGAPGIPCMGNCDGCSLYATFHGQTFTTPSDVGFIKYAAAKPNVGGVTLRFTIIEGDNPNGNVIGSWDSYYLESTLGGEMIGGEAMGDGIPVEPNTTYFLKIERTDGQGVYLYTSNTNPYSGGIRWVGNTPQPGWDIYGAIRGNTLEVITATGTIAGTVEDEQGQPIAGANVSTSPGGQSATTNGSGQYTIGNVPIGTYGVTASASGYTSSTVMNVIVSPDATSTADFALAIGPSTGTLAGTVKDASNAPLPGAVVQTTSGGYATSTATDGTYALNDVLPGTYTVQASKTGYQTQAATGVQVSASQTTMVNFTLPVDAPFAGLSNWDFEGGFFDDPDPDHRTGNSWHRFVISGSPKHGVTWLGGGAHSSDHVQDFWETQWTAGVYQQVPNASVGSLYTGSVWVKGSGNTFWVGIDPAGGTNASSANIQWSNPVGGTSGWQQLNIEATAQSSTVTLFLKAQNTGGGNAYFDDADLDEQLIVTPEPLVARNPGTLSPSVDMGENAASDTFTVWNGVDNGTTLNYAVTDDAAWLSVAPASGDSTGPGDVDTLDVSYTTTGLAPGNHAATITITDPAATNVSETITVSLTVVDTSDPLAPADFDLDGDVDLDDYAHFQFCLTGSSIVQTDPACLNARLDAGDFDVDSADLALFMDCLSGTNVPADPNCLD